jgi:hypothetical protein
MGSAGIAMTHYILSDMNVKVMGIPLAYGNLLTTLPRWRRCDGYGPVGHRRSTPTGL